MRSPRSSLSNSRHLLVAQLEVEELDVLADPLRRHRLGDDHVAELQVPAQDRLGRGLAVPLGDRGDRLVVEQLALGERAPGLGGDAVLGVPGAQLGLLEARVQLDLVDGRPGLGLGLQPFEILDAEVGDADRARAPLLVDPFEGAPGVDEAILARAPASGSGRGRRGRGRAGRGLPRRPPGSCRSPAAEFQSLVVTKSSSRGRPEAAIARADAFLVAVGGGGVDVAVAGLERLLDHAPGCPRAAPGRRRSRAGGSRRRRGG